MSHDKYIGKTVAHANKNGQKQTSKSNPNIANQIIRYVSSPAQRSSSSSGCVRIRSSSWILISCLLDSITVAPPNIAPLALAFATCLLNFEKQKNSAEKPSVADLHVYTIKRRMPALPWGKLGQILKRVSDGRANIKEWGHVESIHWIHRD